MSYWTDKRNGTSMGDPTKLGRHPVDGRGSTAGKNTGNGAKSASFKNGSILKGIPAHSTGEFPKFPGYGKGGKEQRNSTIKRGSI
jgi:hypothetical protein